MNVEFIQTRRCDECGAFFNVPLVREDPDEERFRVRIAGPWNCRDCRNGLRKRGMIYGNSRFGNGRHHDASH